MSFSVSDISHTEPKINCFDKPNAIDSIGLDLCDLCDLCESSESKRPVESKNNTESEKPEESKNNTESEKPEVSDMKTLSIPDSKNFYNMPLNLSDSESDSESMYSLDSKDSQDSDSQDSDSQDLQDSDSRDSQDTRLSKMFYQFLESTESHKYDKSHKRAEDITFETVRNAILEKYKFLYFAFSKLHKNLKHTASKSELLQTSIDLCDLTGNDMKYIHYYLSERVKYESFEKIKYFVIHKKSKKTDSDRYLYTYNDSKYNYLYTYNDSKYNYLYTYNDYDYSKYYYKNYDWYISNKRTRV